MMEETEKRIYEFRALSNVWTGTFKIEKKDGNQLIAKPDRSRLITTGLLGSIRWWFEVLVRGLGGYACDPSDESRCPDKDNKHCVVCELFGCTGRSRKFRFEVVDYNGRVMNESIKKSDRDKISFCIWIIPLRHIYPEEWRLLEATFRLISDYGAIGGKTVFKPSEEDDRKNELHHQDFGLVHLRNTIDKSIITISDINNYLDKWCKVDHGVFSWASLSHFWCVIGKHLSRQNQNESTFNFIIGRPMPKNSSENNDPWLAGVGPKSGLVESKKVFSFKKPERTFGFVKNTPQEFKGMKENLKQVWKEDNSWEFLTGSQILQRLFVNEEASE